MGFFYIQKFVSIRSISHFELFWFLVLYIAQTFFPYELPIILLDFTLSYISKIFLLLKALQSRKFLTCSIRFQLVQSISKIFFLPYLAYLWTALYSVFSDKPHFQEETAAVSQTFVIEFPENAKVNFILLHRISPKTREKICTILLFFLQKLIEFRENYSFTWLGLTKFIWWFF